MADLWIAVQVPFAGNREKLLFWVHHWREKYRERDRLLEELREQCAESEAHGETSRAGEQAAAERISELERERAQPQPLQVPLGDVPSGQQYGAGMMALCVNLARKIGLRPTEHALDVVFDWLGVKVDIPTYPTIRLWMQRISLDRMENATKIAGGVWLTDHTNQIGKEKVLVMLRVPDAHGARGGVPLRHEDVEVLTVRPGEAWKREDVEQVYRETAKRYGLPRAVASDGAVELREPAESLGTQRKRPLVLRDPKHFLANKFEALLQRDPQYQAFANQLAGMRSVVQQTELCALCPARLQDQGPVHESATDPHLGVRRAVASGPSEIEKPRGHLPAPPGGKAGLAA